MQVWKYPPNRQPWDVTTQGWQIDNPGLTISWVFPHVRIDIGSFEKLGFSWFWKIALEHIVASIWLVW